MFDMGNHVVLRRDGVCVVLKTPENDMPQVEYWGADFGVSTEESVLALLDQMTLKVTMPEQKPDSPLRPSLLPQGAEAFSGRPGLKASRGAAPVFVRWTRTDVSRGTTNADGATNTDGTATSMTVTAYDETHHVKLTVTLEIVTGGLLIARQTIENTATDGEPLTVDWLESTMPVPLRADHITQFTGRWAFEKQPQTVPMSVGSIARECRRGKTGHDTPWMFIASDGTPQWSQGEIWACHLAWSGDQTYRTDRLPQHEPLIGAGELLGAGEIRLASGEAYETPQVCFAYSNTGLDGMSARFHTWLRALPAPTDTETNADSNVISGQSARRISVDRPVTLNTWEAVYFDHDEATLLKLADKAAQVGIERFVLDDGWYHERRDETRGLGDWWVDPEVWPNGLGVLADHVHELGMQFGLWFEPEMINLDSDLARAHRDWILAEPAAVPYRADVSYRHQYVLDLANPDAYRWVYDHMAALVKELHIDYIKWDHNREVTEAVHDGHYGLHDQTIACYRLFDDLKQAFPGLEIESCSSGGARTDAGILQHADRIWASDSNDPIDRIDIQRFTELIVPPEMIGAHVGPSPAHTTGRATDLSYRCAVSLEGCPGFEWNLLEVPDDQIAQIRTFVGLYKELRPLLFSGTVEHADFKDPSMRARGVVARDGSRAVWVVASVANERDFLLERLTPRAMPADALGAGIAEGTLPGLLPDATYRVRVRHEIGETKHFWHTPAWMNAANTEEGFVTTGRLLSNIGLQLPQLWPVQAMVLDITRI